MGGSRSNNRDLMPSKSESHGQRLAIRRNTSSPALRLGRVPRRAVRRGLERGIFKKDPVASHQVKVGSASSLCVVIHA